MRRYIVKLDHPDTKAVRYYQGPPKAGKISPNLDDAYVYVNECELDPDLEYLNSDKCIAKKAGFNIIVLIETMLENRHRQWVDREIFKDITALDDI